MARAFQSSMEHLLAELRRIDLRLRAEARNARAGNGLPGEDAFRGLYVSESEIDSILAGDHLGSDVASTSSSQAEAEPISDLEASTAERQAESLRQGVSLRLVELRRMFHLGRFETDVLLLCLMPELGLQYEKLYAYLQDDVTRKSPCVELALRLFCISFADRLAAREVLSPQAPLMKHHLVRLESDPPGTASLLGKAMKGDGRILGYLLGSDTIDSRLLPFARLAQPGMTLEQVVLDQDVKRRLSRLARRGSKSTVFRFQGPSGSGRLTAAQGLCSGLERPLLVIDVPRLLADETSFDTGVRLALREAMLLGAAVYWEDFDMLLADDRRRHLDVFLQQLKDWDGLSFLAGQSTWEQPDAWPDMPLVHVGFPAPACPERERLWKAHMNGDLHTAQDVDLAELSNKFKLSGGQIRSAVFDARNRALWRGSGRLSMEDLRAACQAQSNRRLASLARKVESKYTWADIVLPREQMAQLEDITRSVKYRQLVYGEWKFEEKVALGKGLSVLFAGPSGTGKTMAAGIIANELKLDIYKIDLATVVSKYIGETEKNLSSIFAEAETSNAILFFDEADALFGKRSEVRDSHDRYANIEIGYLLQRMEEYEGIVILATNLRQNMDDAFVRRMHFIVEFPYPEEEDRYRIWKGIFPRQAPLAQGVDFGFLSRQFKIAGGNIKNIALGAAFLAADDGGMITMKHLARASKREFDKMGKLCVESDFGRYYALVSDD